jgi:uncharacterized protein
MQRLWLLILWMWSVTPVLAVTPIPALTDPVMDTAQILSQNTEDYLNQQLRDLHRVGGSQIVILSVPRLEEETIEQFGIRVADTWKLGTAEKDNGAILLIAAEDRKVRIEVGQGLEGSLTDLYSSRIIREKITPLFREGDYDAGVIAGVAHMVAYTDPDYKFGVDAPQPRTRQVRGERRGGISSLFSLFIFIIVIIIVSLANRGGPRGPFGGGRRGGFGGWGGGGFGGGGFGGGGGGGFGGGGGGFSGGGASGSW